MGCNNPTRKETGRSLKWPCLAVILTVALAVTISCGKKDDGSGKAKPASPDKNRSDCPGYEFRTTIGDLLK